METLGQHEPGVPQAGPVVRQVIETVADGVPCLVIILLTKCFINILNSQNSEWSSCSFPILSLLSLLSLCVRLLHEWSPTKSGLLRSNMAKLLQRLSLELVVQTPKTRRGSTAVWWETSNLRWTSMLVSLLFLMAPEPLKFLSWSHRTCWQLCYRSTPGCFWVAARLVRNLKDWSCRFGMPTERSILRMTFSNMIEPDSLGQFLWRFMVMVEERKRNSHWRYFPSSPPSDSTVLVAENHAVAAAR